jgi:sarcosine/dimethylglycine N-methyltransferase
MATAYSEVVETARQYYNSDDADNFYFHVWGGEDIHIGLYQRVDEPIAEASRRTVARMAGMLSGLDAHSRVIDLGAGYGGSARYLARTTGCHVTALNLSETENARSRAMAAEQGLTGQIEVVDGSFEQIPAADAAFDVAWSQDAILHSGQRRRVIREVARVLKPGGHFIFTDPMQADDCPPGVLEPVLERIHLDSLGSFAFYREAAAAAGLEEVEVVDLTPQLPRHYSRVRDELERQRAALAGKVSDAYIERMLKGLGHWIEAGENGFLAWGILLFRKPA